jgi:hypothetical protein
LMVPVLYSIFVLDLKILAWERQEEKSEGSMPSASGSPTAAATSSD